VAGFGRAGAGKGRWMRTAAGLLLAAVHLIPLCAWVDRLPAAGRGVLLAQRSAQCAAGMSAQPGDAVGKLILPAVVLGTFQLKGEVVRSVVREGIRNGARAIDTASVYRNEADIGEAIKESGVARSELFITSKLGPSEQGYEPAKKAIRASLDRLQTEYLDLYLIHWPGSSKTPPMSPKNRENRLESWRALEEAHDLGLARHIGVSNFHRSHLADLLAHARITPVVNQVEFHAEYIDRPLLQMCQDHGVLIQGYSPLGSPDGKESLLSHAQVAQVASRLGITKAQVLIKWAIERTNGRSVVFRTSNLSRIAENLASADAPRLSEADLASLDGICLRAARAVHDGGGNSEMGKADEVAGDKGLRPEIPGKKYCWDAADIA